MDIKDYQKKLNEEMKVKNVEFDTELKKIRLDVDVPITSLSNENRLNCYDEIDSIAIKELNRIYPDEKINPKLIGVARSVTVKSFIDYEFKD